MSGGDPRSRSRAMLEGPHRAGAHAMLRAFGLKEPRYRDGVLAKYVRLLTSASPGRAL
jgi:hypothetical protein